MAWIRTAISLISPQVGSIFYKTFALLGLGKVVTKFSGHKKRINGVAFHPDFNSTGLIFSASSDQTMKVWKGTNKGTKSEVLWSYGGHTHEVQGISVHPSGSYALSFSSDGHWSFLSIEHQMSLKTMPSESR